MSNSGQLIGNLVRVRWAAIDHDHDHSHGKTQNAIL